MIKHIQTSNNILEYIRKFSLHEDSILYDLRQETKNLHEKNMQILPEQGQFLELIVSMMKAKKALEIGVFTGYSSICIARGLKKNGGTLIACDNNEKWTNIAQCYWKKAKINTNIKLFLNKAVNTLNTLHDNNEDGSFDFVFIDADKENYDLYYEHALKLLKIGGLIILDNTLWSGKVADYTINDNTTRALRKLNEKLFHDKRIDLSFLPFADGLSLIYKK